MQQTKHLSIVIPVYNEGKVIRKVIDSLPKKIAGISKISIIAINDGSTDNSEEEIKSTKALLYSLPINLGYGGASNAGLKVAQKLNSDVVVTFDGDGQHSPADITKIIRPILDNKADLIIGTRFKDSNIPLIKRFGIRLMNFITFALCGRWINDSQCGLKAFSSKALNKLDMRSLGMEFASETIIEAKRNKLKIKEIPVEIVYTNYSKQKGQPALNGINIFVKLILKILVG